MRNALCGEKLAMRARMTVKYLVAMAITATAMSMVAAAEPQPIGGRNGYLAYPGYAYRQASPYAAQPVAYEHLYTPDFRLVQNGVPTPAAPQGLVPGQTPPTDYAPLEPMSDSPYIGCGPEVGCAADASCTPEVEKCRANQWFVRGWLAQGFTGNPDDPVDRMNTPMGFNDRSNEYQLNQLYLTGGRAIQEGCSWDIGGRVDLLYGTDYRFVQALGLETRRDSRFNNKWNGMSGPVPPGQSLYGLAMPQLYGEVYAPIGQGIRVKMGHFYSIMGYESAMSPNNFFYSHSYTMIFGEPFTHTGMLASGKIGSRWTWQAGFTRGWDIWEPYSPNVGSDELSFLGGLRWESCSRRTSLAFTVHTGKEPIIATGLGGNFYASKNLTAYSLVGSHQLTRRLQLVFQHDLGVHDDAAFDRIQATRDDALWYSFSQYAFYNLTNTVAVGIRAEYFKDKYNSRVLAFPSQTDVTGDDYFDVTLGLNWKPTACVTIRPEARWDWSGVDPFGLGGMYHDNQKKDQFTAAIDCVITF